MSTRTQPLIVKVGPFEGELRQVDVFKVDKHGYLGESTDVFMIVDRNTGEELDNGYQSFAEASKAWPEAVNAKRGRR
jgi:hypothetical protein